jgi:ribosomal protein L12E/L44/L45/RPP1/RPP2
MELKLLVRLDAEIETAAVELDEAEAEADVLVEVLGVVLLDELLQPAIKPAAEAAAANANTRPYLLPAPRDA